MASSRRLSNGRSPLVRKQSQITTFFSPGKSTIANPTPSPTATPGPNTNPKPNPTPTPNTSSSKGKQKKTLIAIPPSPASNPRTPPTYGKKAYSEEVIGKRIKVFWPLDKDWYEGCIKSFDGHSGKHLVQYDDGEEEALDLKNEKVEWVEEETPRSLQRLRRMSGSGTASECSNMIMEEQSSGEDTTDDEDWGKGIGKDAEDDDSEEVELEEEEEVVVSSRRGQGRSDLGLKKRKKIEVEKLVCIKKVRFDGNGEKSALETPVNKNRSCSTVLVSNAESK